MFVNDTAIFSWRSNITILKSFFIKYHVNIYFTKTNINVVLHNHLKLYRSYNHPDFSVFNDYISSLVLYVVLLNDVKLL